mmetsp:Transcript_20668/g.57095  ORF Transcript_20668/g.57095 Transcript_20668/m.57095 type:complete len:151 (-) Transcript_20668:1042-1494(-)
MSNRGKMNIGTVLRGLTILSIIIVIGIPSVHSTATNSNCAAENNNNINLKSTMGTTTTTTSVVDQKHGLTLSFLDELRLKYPHQPTFLQAVEEMALSLVDLFQDPEQGEFYKRAFLVMTEPERIISFRVPWTDDQGQIHINRGWRVEFNR